MPFSQTKQREKSFWGMKHLTLYVHWMSLCMHEREITYSCNTTSSWANIAPLAKHVIRILLKLFYLISIVTWKHFASILRGLSSALIMLTHNIWFFRWVWQVGALKKEGDEFLYRSLEKKMNCSKAQYGLCHSLWSSLCCSRVMWWCSIVA